MVVNGKANVSNVTRTSQIWQVPQYLVSGAFLQFLEVTIFDFLVPRTPDSKKSNQSLIRRTRIFQPIFWIRQVPEKWIVGYRVLIACSKPGFGLPWLFWALVTSWYFEFKIRCNTFFSPFLKLLDCCWIVFLLPQGTNWAIQRSAAKQTDVDEMRGSTFHWYLVSNNSDYVFANATDEQQRRWGWSWCALPNGRVSKFLATALLPPLSTLSTAACVLSFFLETANELYLLPLFSQLISSLYAFSCT